MAYELKRWPAKTRYWLIATVAPSVQSKTIQTPRNVGARATGPHVIVLPTVENIHLPPRYQRRPLDQREIDYINVSCRLVGPRWINGNFHVNSHREGSILSYSFPDRGSVVNESYDCCTSHVSCVAAWWTGMSSHGESFRISASHVVT